MTGDAVTGDAVTGDAVTGDAAVTRNGDAPVPGKRDPHWKDRASAG